MDFVQRTVELARINVGKEGGLIASLKLHSDPGWFIAKSTGLGEPIPLEVGEPSWPPPLLVWAYYSLITWPASAAHTARSSARLSALNAS